MPIQAGWYDEAAGIYLWTFTGEWTWAEMGEMWLPIVLEQEKLSHRFDSIYDVTGSHVNIMNAVTGARNLLQSRPPVSRLTVVIATGYVRDVAEVVDDALKLSPVRIRIAIVGTLEEALQAIYNDRARGTGDMPKV
jgi:hypothetical protein